MLHASKLLKSCSDAANLALVGLGKFPHRCSAVEGLDEFGFLFLRPGLPRLLQTLWNLALHFGSNGRLGQGLGTHEECPNNMCTVQWAVFREDFTGFRIEASPKGFKDLGSFVQCHIVFGMSVNMIPRREDQWPAVDSR